LIVRVPGNFLVHVSGVAKQHASNSSRDAGEHTIRIRQTAHDGYPFVIAGRYVAATLAAGQETVNLWTRAPEPVESLRQPSEALARAMNVYDTIFGPRIKDSHQLWLVECPQVAGCFSITSSNFARLMSDGTEPITAEMASRHSRQRRQKA
jgi:hypothetical protein